MRHLWQLPLQNASIRPEALIVPSVVFTGRRNAFEASCTLSCARSRPRASCSNTKSRVRLAAGNVATYSTSTSQTINQHDRGAYWLKHLQDGYRIQSISAIGNTWRVIKESGDAVPMQGPVAEEIWKLLLHDYSLHVELFEYALLVKSTSGIIFDKFYEFLLQRLLQHAWTVEPEYKENVLRWHYEFLDKYFIRPGSLNELVHVAKLSRSNLELFRHIYRRGSCFPRQGIYDELVPDLCRMHEWRLALEWHFFLYSQRDFPRGSSFFKQGFKARPSLEQAMSEFMSKQIGAEPVQVPATLSAEAAKSEAEVFNPANLAHIRDEELKSALAQMDDKPRHAPLSDEFCARLIATESFSLASVINYLEMFDHGKLGPLALRELMARSKDLDEAIGNIKAFDDADIAIGLSVYPQIIKQFVDNRQWDLLQNLVNSDLHPETLHDYHTQTKLFKHYVLMKDQLSARRTLEILRKINPSQHNGLKSQDPIAAINELLALDNGGGNAGLATDTVSKFEVICNIRQSSICQVLFDDWLSQGLSFANSEFKNLANANFDTYVKHGSQTFKSNAFLRLLKYRQSPPPWFIKAIIGQQGRSFQLQQAFRLYQFFIGQYHARPQFSKYTNVLGTQQDRMTNPWVEIAMSLQPAVAANFTVHHALHYAAAAFVEWGAKSAVPSLLSTDSFHSCPAGVFFVGLRYVSELGRQGFMSDRKTIAAAVNKRLLLLAGPGYSRREVNNTIKRHNYFTLEELLLAVEQMWTGDRLFPEIYNEPGVAIDRTPQSTPRYYQHFYQNLQNKGQEPWTLDSVPPPLDFLAVKQMRGDDAWSYQQFDDLRQRFGGSMLDGLVFTPAQSSTPALPRKDRIERRIHLRYLFFGTNAPANFDSEQVRWHEQIFKSAVEADESLVRAGLCKAE